MSLLQLKNDPVHEDDASSHGEDLAKGSSYLLWTTLAAFVLISAGIFFFVLAIRKPPAAAGEVTGITAHGVHTLNTPVDAAGVQTPGEAFDQVLVFSDLRIHNQSKEPIVLGEMLTNITLEDGIHSSYAATATDYDRIFVAYPELAPLHSKTLVRDTIIAPGETIEGSIISAFHVSKEDWSARKDLNYTVEFKYRPSLTITPKVPVRAI